MYSCSADKTINVWDLIEGKRIKKYKDHDGIVNSVQAARRDENVFVSSSDDMTVKLFDERVKQAVDSLKLNYQPTCATFSDTNEYVFYGGLDNQIKAWNLKNEESNEFTLIGHTDTVTGNSLTLII
jgi:Prp8 binding protein